MKPDSFSKNALRLCVTSVLLMGGSNAHASTLANYRQRVAQAAAAVDQLQTPDSLARQIIRREDFIETTIAHVKSLLPSKETVSFKNQNVEVDNSWLYEALADYQKNQTDYRRSAKIFKRISERLRALLERLDETEQLAAPVDKDESKGRLAEILRRPEYDKSAAQGSALERLWERFIRWLSSLFPRAKPLQPGTGRALSGIAQVVVIVVSLGLIAFLVWKFGPRFLRSRGKRKKQKREPRIVLGEQLEPDQTAADLLEQAERLARSGDLRAAIRKAYIALLCELGDRKIISLARHKTNRDYLSSVRGRISLYQSMRKLTANFERHWYGFVPARLEDWAEFRAGCQSAIDVRQS